MFDRWSKISADITRLGDFSNQLKSLEQQATDFGRRMRYWNAFPDDFHREELRAEWKDFLKAAPAGTGHVLLDLYLDEITKPE